MNSTPQACYRIEGLRLALIGYVGQGYGQSIALTERLAASRATNGISSTNRMTTEQVQPPITHAIPSINGLKNEQSQYDAVGNLIEDSGRHYNWDGESRFLYDGWNLMAEPNPTYKVLRHFAWGLDLSDPRRGRSIVGKQRSRNLLHQL